MGKVQSSFFIVDDRDGDFTGTTTSLQFRHCSSDDVFPIEIIAEEKEVGVTLGLDLTLIDALRLYRFLDKVLSNILK